VNNAKKHLGFDDRWLMAIGIPFCALLVLLMMFGVQTINPNFGICILISMAYTFSYWVSFRWLLIGYHKKFPGYDFDIERLLYVIIRLGIMYLTVKGIIALIIGLLLPEYVGQTILEYQTSPFIGEIAELLLITLIFFIYEGIYYFNKSRLIEIEKNKLEKISVEHQLSTLKNQVNPHFLFNSLNTLVSIIPEEPNLAITFVRKLSKTYRNILELRDEKLVTLQEEIKALDAYIFLLKTRFQNKIVIYNHIDEKDMDKFILPLSLQLLIENAIKHNVTSRQNPLKIGIYIEDNHIVVQNNLQKKNQEYSSTKMGLANIKSRYYLIAEKDIIVSETNENFTVKLPIIQNIS